MIAIIDYGAGNLTSVARALKKIGYTAKITDDLGFIRSSEKVIFPGVGAAKATMDNLKKLGLDQVLKETYDLHKPMLGICIGVQIIFEHSEEGDTECLGILPGRVKRFDESLNLKVPQIGWNTIHQLRPHPIFEDIPNPAYFYFVNSYYPVPQNDLDIIGKTVYGIEFASVIAHDNLIATQFHLEKSGEIGLRMLRNFCEL